MILGDLIVLVLIFVPIALPFVALRSNPMRLVDRFGPAVRQAPTD